MKKTLSPSEIAELLPMIKKVLETGAPWKNKVVHRPAYLIVDAILSIPGMAKKETEEGDREGFDTNEWPPVWWKQFTYAGKDYILSGSGYFGAHSFYVSINQSPAPVCAGVSQYSTAPPSCLQPAAGF